MAFSVSVFVFRLVLSNKQNSFGVRKYALTKTEIIVVRERCIEKKLKKKLTSVSFMYVCVAENGEMLVFFLRFFSSQQ